MAPPKTTAQRQIKAALNAIKKKIKVDPPLEVPVEEYSFKCAKCSNRIWIGAQGCIDRYTKSGGYERFHEVIACEVPV